MHMLQISYFCHTLHCRFYISYRRVKNGPLVGNAIITSMNLVISRVSSNNISEILCQFPSIYCIKFYENVSWCFIYIINIARISMTWYNRTNEWFIHLDCKIGKTVMEIMEHHCFSSNAWKIYRNSIDRHTLWYMAKRNWYQATQQWPLSSHQTYVTLIVSNVAISNIKITCFFNLSAVRHFSTTVDLYVYKFSCKTFSV